MVTTVPQLEATTFLVSYLEKKTMQHRRGRDALQQAAHGLVPPSSAANVKAQKKPTSNPPAAAPAPAPAPAAAPAPAGQQVSADGAVGAAETACTDEEVKEFLLLFNDIVTRCKALGKGSPQDKYAQYVELFGPILERAIENVDTVRGRALPMLKAFLFARDVLEDLDDARHLKTDAADRGLREKDLDGLVYCFLGVACATLGNEELKALNLPKSVMDLVRSFKGRELRPLPQMAGTPAERRRAAEALLPQDGEVAKTRKKNEVSNPHTFQDLSTLRNDLRDAIITMLMNHVASHIYSWLSVLAVTDVALAKGEPVDDVRRMFRLARRAFLNIVDPPKQKQPAPATEAEKKQHAELAAAQKAAADAAKSAKAAAKKLDAAQRKLDAAQEKVDDAKNEARKARSRGKAAQKPATSASRDLAAARIARRQLNTEYSNACKVAKKALAALESLKKKTGDVADADVAMINALERAMRKRLTERNRKESRLPTSDELKNEKNVFFFLRFARLASEGVAAYNKLANRKKRKELRKVHFLPEVKPHQSFVHIGVQSMADLLMRWIGYDVVPEAWRTDAHRKKLPRDQVVASFAKVLPPGALDSRRFWVFSFMTDGRSIRATGHVLRPARTERTEDSAGAAPPRSDQAAAKIGALRRDDFDKARKVARESGKEDTKHVECEAQRKPRRVWTEQEILDLCLELEQEYAAKQGALFKKLHEKLFGGGGDGGNSLIKVLCTIDPGVTNIATVVFAYLSEDGKWKVDPLQRLRMHYASLLRRRQSAVDAGRPVSDGVAKNIARIEATNLDLRLRAGHREPIIMTTKDFVDRGARNQLRREYETFCKGTSDAAKAYRALLQRATNCDPGDVAERLRIHEELRHFDIKHPGRRNRKYTSLLRRQAAIDEFVNRIVGNYSKEEVVIGVGDWALRPTTGRFKLTPPIKQLLAALRKRATVVMLQEYHTSAACCSCGAGSPSRTTTKDALLDVVTKKERKSEDDESDDDEAEVDEVDAPHMSRRDQIKAKKVRKAAKKAAKKKAKAEARAARKAMSATVGPAMTATNEDAAAAAVVPAPVSAAHQEWKTQESAMHVLRHGLTKNTVLTPQQTALIEARAPRARHGTAVCTNTSCSIIWQRDINGATNLLHLLLAQIKGGKQTNEHRPAHLKIRKGVLPPVPDDWSFAEVKKHLRLNSATERPCSCD